MTLLLCLMSIFKDARMSEKFMSNYICEAPATESARHSSLQRMQYQKATYFNEKSNTWLFLSSMPESNSSYSEIAGVLSGIF